MPKFHIEPRDVPVEWAAKRLDMTPADFALALPNLIARGSIKNAENASMCCGGSMVISLLR
jgi:hypothetical protein